MKMLSLIFTPLMAIFIAMNMSAQDCKMFFPVEKDAEITMKSYNAKDKLTGSSINKILDKQIDGNSIKVIFSSHSFDEKGKDLASGQMEVKCVDGIFYIDMKNFLDKQMMEAYKDMQVEIEANNAMQFPGNFDVGATLPDANIRIKFSNQGIPMLSMAVNIINRKIEGKETITVPAGSFECYKMSYDVETKTMMTIKTKAIDWFAENVGTVRTESFDKGGKLLGYTILESIK